MSQTMPEFAQTIIEGISQDTDKLISKRIDKAPFDKTYAGIISEILFEPDTKPDDIRFGQYKVRYGNSERKFKLNDGLVHEIGERVTVRVFENNPNRIYIEPTITRIVPYKIVYNNENDTFVEYRKVKTNGQVYELESEYKLTVENKGTDQEEVTKMTLPNGDIIEFEGWDM